MSNDAVADIWPHAAALREIRARAGGLSAERAAARIGASRASWVAWETGRQRPSYEKLAAIVEEYQCPPDLVGYEPPRGWELVPQEWMQAEFASLYQFCFSNGKLSSKSSY